MKAQKRIGKGFSEKIKMSGLTKGLTKCVKKGLTNAISLIQKRLTNYCNYLSNYSCLLVIYLNALKLVYVDCKIHLLKSSFNYFMYVVHT